MLTTCGMQHRSLIDYQLGVDIYKRSAAIIVRSGNPNKFKYKRDLTRDNINILDVNGAGQFDLWDDIAGKKNLIPGI